MLVSVPSLLGTDVIGQPGPRPLFLQYYNGAYCHADFSCPLIQRSPRLLSVTRFFLKQLSDSRWRDVFSLLLFYDEFNVSIFLLRPRIDWIYV